MATIVKPTANVTVGYVDIASYDLLDALMYGGDSVTTLFSRSIKKYSWFTHLFAPMKNTGTIDSPAFSFSKTPDFALMTWYEAGLPQITVNPASNGQLTWRIAYSWNLAHNLFNTGSLTFNDLTAQSFDSVLLDFLAQYRQDAAKWSLYQKMIGNTTALQTFSSVLPAAIVKLPCPYWYQRDSSYALPLCCASLNDIKENLTVQTDLTQLIRVQQNTASDVVHDQAVWTDVTAGSVNFAQILQVQNNKPLEPLWVGAWAKYVLVTDEERAQHQDTIMDVIIEQFQKANGTKATPGDSRLEFHFTNPVKTLFFGFQNVTSLSYNNLSNYTDTRTTGVTPNDPVSLATLTYENQDRFTNCPGALFDMETFVHASRAVSEVGYHALFYCININDLDMTGSSNYSNLVTTMSFTVAEGASQEGNTYMMVLRAISANRVRFASSTFGFPALTSGFDTP
jgi:hypothetical protein